MMDSAHPHPQASFVIPTRNRKHILLECVHAALRQSVPVEVLVFDDGSTDGTPEALEAAFPAHRHPNLRYERLGGGNGPCVLRNRGIRLARSEFVFPIDDDAVLTSPDTVVHVLSEFDHPRVAAVGIPYINIRQSPEVRQRAPDDRHTYAIAAYVGASHAVRRSAFLAVGGYRESLVQYGEEGDVCLRLLSRGYICKAGTAPAIHHHQSTSRALAHQNRLGPRNNLYLAWCNAPWGVLPSHLVATTFNCLRWGLRQRTFRNSAIGVVQGYTMIARNLRHRDPISASTFWLFRKLRQAGPTPLSQIEPSLPLLIPAETTTPESRTPS